MSIYSAAALKAAHVVSLYTQEGMILNGCGEKNGEKLSRYAPKGQHF